MSFVSQRNAQSYDNYTHRKRIKNIKINILEYQKLNKILKIRSINNKKVLTLPNFCKKKDWWESNNLIDQNLIKRKFQKLITGHSFSVESQRQSKHEYMQRSTMCKNLFKKKVAGQIIQKRFLQSIQNKENQIDQTKNWINDNRVFPQKTEQFKQLKDKFFKGKKTGKKQQLRVQTTLIEMIKRKQFENLPNNVFFYFLKGKDCYDWILQKKFDPKKNFQYTTASKSGIVFVSGKQQVFCSLKQFQLECYIHLKSQLIPFIRNFNSIKIFKRWRTFLKKKNFSKNKEKLEKKLLIINPCYIKTLRKIEYYLRVIFKNFTDQQEGLKGIHTEKYLEKQQEEFQKNNLFIIKIQEKIKKRLMSALNTHLQQQNIIYKEQIDIIREKKMEIAKKINLQKNERQLVDDCSIFSIKPEVLQSIDRVCKLVFNLIVCYKQNCLQRIEQQIRQQTQFTIKLDTLDFVPLIQQQHEHEGIISIKVIEFKDKIKFNPCYKKIKQTFIKYLDIQYQQIDQIYDIDFYENFKHFFKKNIFNKQVLFFMQQLKEKQKGFFSKGQKDKSLQLKNHVANQIRKNYKFIKMSLEKSNYLQRSQDIIDQLNLHIFQKFNIKSIKSSICQMNLLKNELNKNQVIINVGIFQIDMKLCMLQILKNMQQQFRIITKNIPNNVNINIQAYNKKIKIHEQILNVEVDSYDVFIKYSKQLESCKRFFFNFDYHQNKLLDLIGIYEIKDFGLCTDKDTKLKFEHTIFMLTKICDIFHQKQEIISKLKYKYKNKFLKESHKMQHCIQDRIKTLQDYVQNNIVIKNFQQSRIKFDEVFLQIKIMIDNYDSMYMQQGIFQSDIKQKNWIELEQFVRYQQYLNLVDDYICCKDKLLNKVVNEFDYQHDINNLVLQYNLALKSRIQIDNVLNQINVDFLQTQIFFQKLSEYKAIEYNFPINEFKTYMKRNKIISKDKEIYCFKDLKNIQIKVFDNFFQAYEKQKKFKSFSMVQEQPNKIIVRKNTVF